MLRDGLCWDYCLGNTGGIWPRSRHQRTGSGTGDKINTARPPGTHPQQQTKCTFDQVTLNHTVWKQLWESKGLRLRWMPHPGHTYLHERAYHGYLPCIFWHKRAVGAVLLLGYQFIASVSSSSHNCFIANPFTVRCINHAAGCQGSPFMLLCRLQARGAGNSA